jgi:hypothetical protein
LPFSNLAPAARRGDRRDLRPVHGPTAPSWSTQRQGSRGGVLAAPAHAQAVPPERAHPLPARTGSRNCRSSVDAHEQYHGKACTAVRRLRADRRRRTGRECGTQILAVRGRQPHQRQVKPPGRQWRRPAPGCGRCRGPKPKAVQAQPGPSAVVTNWLAKLHIRWLRSRGRVLRGPPARRGMDLPFLAADTLATTEHQALQCISPDNGGRGDRPRPQPAPPKSAPGPTASACRCPTRPTPPRNLAGLARSEHGLRAQQRLVIRWIPCPVVTQGSSRYAGISRRKSVTAPRSEASGYADDGAAHVAHREPRRDRRAATSSHTGLHSGRPG